MTFQDVQPATTPGAERFKSVKAALPIVVFLVPAVFFLLVFLLYPLISSFQLSLLDWNGLGSGEKYVGLDNWVRLAHDKLFWNAVRNNLALAFFSVLFQLPVALVLAVVLDEASKGSRVLKILYFLPLLMSSVALGVVFKNIYDPNFGPINGLLGALHLDGLAHDWLGDPRLALGSVIAVICWQNIPFYMVLFLAGLSSFPRELGEAARLDGASESTLFWRIKLPFLQGTIRTAITAAETGHLVFATLHASDCVGAIERFVSVFPEGEQTSVRHQLSLVLRGVFAQHLLPLAAVLVALVQLRGQLCPLATVLGQRRGLFALLRTRLLQFAAACQDFLLVR